MPATPPPLPDARQGTGLTPGFSEILANWDNVLKSLDKVNAYTAEKANEAASRLAKSCKDERPTLLGETTEGTEWQRRARVKPPAGSRLDFPPFTAAEGIEDGGRTGASVDRRLSSEQLERWGRRFDREADRSLLAETFAAWRQAGADSRAGLQQAQREKLREEAQAEAQEQQASLQATLESERDIAARLRLARSARCKAALSCWQQASLREVAVACFDAWRSDSATSRAAAAAASASSEASAAEAAAIAEAAEAAAANALAQLQQKDEELVQLRSQLAASEQSRQSAEAEVASSAAAAAAATTALHKAEEQLRTAESEASKASAELTSTKVELGVSRQALGAVEKQCALAKQEVQQLRTNGSQDSVAEARKALSDFTIRLARSEADTAEARTEARRYRTDFEQLQATFVHARKELELVYGVLANLEGSHQQTVNNLKGTVRDRELALAHLYHLMEQFRKPMTPVAPDEDLRLKADRTSPSSQAPTLPTSASLPSLSSMSPQSGYTGAGRSRNLSKEMEDRKKRWSAGWH